MHGGKCQSTLERSFKLTKAPLCPCPSPHPASQPSPASSDDDSSPCPWGTTLGKQEPVGVTKTVRTYKGAEQATPRSLFPSPDLFITDPPGCLRLWRARVIKTPRRLCSTTTALLRTGRSSGWSPHPALRRRPGSRIWGKAKPRKQGLRRTLPKGVGKKKGLKIFQDFPPGLKTMGDWPHPTATKSQRKQILTMVAALRLPSRWRRGRREVFASYSATLRRSM